MKIRAQGNAGSVLMVILVTIVLLGITLASYLNLVANQNLSVMRSMAWNSAIPLAEAGIEEAMAHLNRNGTNRSRDGWTMEGTNWVKERFVGENKYKVLMSDTEPPIILASGYVKIPNKDQFIEPPRTVRVSTTNDSLFAKGMVAKGEIDLSGNRIKTDSFDSTDTNYSSNGQYDPNKNKDGGDVATNSAVIDSLDVWNADVWGKASTGPGGTVKIGPNGAVGSRAWHESGKNGIEPGWATDDMNVYFPDVQAPFSSGAFAPVGARVNNVNYEYVLGTGNYVLPFLSLSGQNKVLVTGHAVLLVEGDVSLSGQSSITIASGGSLQMYVKGANSSLGGSGVVNQTGSALNFGYWGMNSNTQVSFTGNAAFVGTIYAPYANLKLGGGGNNDHDFVGASVSSSVQMNGHFNFHYDEALKKWGPRRGYTIINWNESGWTEI